VKIVYPVFNVVKISGVHLNDMGLHEPMNTETILKKKYRVIGQEAINPDGSFAEN